MARRPNIKLPDYPPEQIDFKVSAEVAIREAKPLIGFVAKGGKLTVDLLIMRALGHGSDWALRASGANSRRGAGYGAAFSRWLDENAEYREIGDTFRASALFCWENLEAVEAFLPRMNRHQRETMGLRGIQGYIEAEQRGRQVRQEEPRPPTAPTELQMLRRRWRAVSGALRELGMVFEYDDDFDRGSMSLLSAGELRDWMSSEIRQLGKAADVLRAIAEPEDQSPPVASPHNGDGQEPL